MIPTKTDWMKGQMQHEPSKLYGEGIIELIKKYKPDYKNALEIGNAWGISTLAILGAGKGKLTSVDKAQPHRAFEEVIKNNYIDRIHFKQFKSKEFWPQNTDKFDIVYIDGSHLYEDVIVDFMEGWDALEKNVLFFCDDYLHIANMKIDTDRNDTIYGISYALWEMINAKKITKIGTTDRFFWSIK